MEKNKRLFFKVFEKHQNSGFYLKPVEYTKTFPLDYKISELIKVIYQHVWDFTGWFFTQNTNTDRSHLRQNLWAKQMQHDIWTKDSSFNMFWKLWKVIIVIKMETGLIVQSYVQAQTVALTQSVISTACVILNLFCADATQFIRLYLKFNLFPKQIP